jgi:hypothetical protein
MCVHKDYTARHALHHDTFRTNLIVKHTLPMEAYIPRTVVLPVIPIRSMPHPLQTPVVIPATVAAEFDCFVHGQLSTDPERDPSEGYVPTVEWPSSDMRNYPNPMVAVHVTILTDGTYSVNPLEGNWATWYQCSGPYTGT